MTSSIGPTTSDLNETEYIIAKNYTHTNGYPTTTDLNETEYTIVKNYTHTNDIIKYRWIRPPPTSMRQSTS